MKRHYTTLIGILKTIEGIGLFLVLLTTAVFAAFLAHNNANSAFPQANVIGIIVGVLLSGAVLATFLFISLEWSISVIDLLSRIELNTRIAAMEQEPDQQPKN